MDRPLSAGEQLLWSLDRAVPQNFVMVAHLSGVPANFSELLRRALDLVQQRQPTLRCKIETGVPPSFCTGKIPPIPLHTKKRTSPRQWIRECETEMLLPIPWPEGPLARALVLEDGDCRDLLITLCHISADATAGVKMVKQVLTFCQQLNAGQAPAPIDPLPPLPSILDLFKPEVLEKAKKAPGVHGAIPPGTGPAGVAELHCEADALPNLRITRVLHRRLNPDHSRQLLLFARKEKTTLHAVLCSALLQAMAAQIRIAGNAVDRGDSGDPGVSGDSGVPRDPRPFLMVCMSPVNVRHHLRVPIEDTMGNYISNAVHVQPISDTASLFDAARNTSRALRRELDNYNDVRALLEAHRFLRANEEPHDTLMRLKDSFAPTAVTDMGVLDIPSRFGPFRLDLLHYIPAMNPVVKNGFGLSVSGFDGSIILDFLYAEPCVSENRARRMADTAVFRLENPYSTDIPRRLNRLDF